MLEDLKYRVRLSQSYFGRLILYPSLVLSGLILFHLGYNTNINSFSRIDGVIEIGFYTLFNLYVLLTVGSVWATKKVKLFHYAQFILIVYFVFIAVCHSINIPGLGLFQKQEWLYLGVLMLTLMELSKGSLFLENLYFNPTILFVISFLSLILLGAFLLMLPNTVKGPPLRFVDALFMSTSSVCITGLSVVDFSIQFTSFGKGVVLVLIQLGALGIMTFSGFFGYFFSGGFSFKNQLMFGEFLGQGKIGSVLSTLLKIIYVTLMVEFVGAVLIYFSTPASLFSSFGEHAFFSIFHAVSAFCNAGFSTVEQGFYNIDYRFNYGLQSILAILFIMGGLGFTALFNLLTFFRRWLTRQYMRARQKRAFRHQAWIMSFNARLMTWTTVILTIASTLFFLLLEGNSTLAEHESWYGKLIASVFMGNSARTSGFSSINIEQASFPMIILMMFFMWIGASPGSTGGGIKTSTIAVATLNFLSLAKGKEHLEVFNRKVAKDSTNKAFAIIVLSFFTMGGCVFFLSMTDGDKGLKAIAFEAFSAYATCGLSLGITQHLSDAGKIIVMTTMFIGRVGLLTLLVAFIKNLKPRNLSFPEEKVLY